MGEALAWISSTLSTATDKTAFAVALLANCLSLLDHSDPEPTLRQRACQALALLTADDEFPHTVEDSTAERLLRTALQSLTTDTRHPLAHHLLHHGEQEEIWQLQHLGLFPEEDLLYWFTSWPNLSDHARHTAQALIKNRPRPQDPALLQAVEHARSLDADLHAATAWWDGPTPDWQRRHELRLAEERHRHTFRPVAFTAALTTATTAPPDTVRDAWRTLLGHLYRTPDGSLHERPLTLDALATAPSCPIEGSEEHRALTAAATHLLVTASPITAEDIGPSGTDCIRLPDLLALAYLPPAAAKTAVPAHLTDRWALALATLPTTQPTALHHTLLSHCAVTAGHALDLLLLPCLERLNDYGRQRTAENVLVLPMPPRALHLWASAPERTPAQEHSILGPLAQSGHAVARRHLQQTALAGPGMPGSIQQERWVLAVHTLMSCEDLHTNWPAIQEPMATAAHRDALLDRILEHSGPVRGWPAGLADLSEADIANLYTRLTQRPELQGLRPERPLGIAYRPTRTEDLHDLADALLALLAERGTHEAAHQLQLLNDRPSRQRSYLSALRYRTARKAARTSTPPLSLTPTLLHQLVKDRDARVIADEAGLLDVVLEALDKAQTRLSGPNGMATLLWNREQASSGLWWPKWEDDFSDLVMNLLDTQLPPMIINREVQVDRPGTERAGRTDIQIETISFDDSARLRVVIECKGCWNDELSSTIPDQLIDKYLRRLPRSAGILLVGYFHVDDKHRARGSRCSRSHTREQLEQEQQAEAARHTGYRITAKVLDCRLPSSSENSRT